MALTEIPASTPIDGGWPGWTIADYLLDDNLNAYPWFEGRDTNRRSST